MKDLGIIILNYNGTEDTIECLKSIRSSQTIFTYDIYLVDNASDTIEVAKLKSFIDNEKSDKWASIEMTEDVTSGNYFIISHENLGFAGANQKVIEKIVDKYRYILLLNNDTVVDKSFIQKMIYQLKNNPEVKFSSCIINNYYKPNQLWNGGGKLRPWGTRKYYTEKELNKKGLWYKTQFITGCALFLETNNIKKHGGLTTDFFHGEEDFNYCWRMKRHGISGRCLNIPLVYHKISGTSKKSGNNKGKYIGYYINRIIDMKGFYNSSTWAVWKTLVIGVINIKMIIQNTSISELKQMNKIIKSCVSKDKVSKEDTLKIWRFEYSEG